jgi:hypothetical protein
MDAEESEIVEALAGYYVNRYYDGSSEKLHQHLKLAFVNGYTKGMLRAARLVDEMLKAEPKA